MTFKIIQGSYAENNVIYRADTEKNIVDSDKDLIKLFPDKFEKHIEIVDKKVVNIAKEAKSSEKVAKEPVQKKSLKNKKRK